jgi:hypothetical protein
VVILSPERAGGCQYRTVTHPVLGSGLAASFFYLAITPDGEVELLDAVQVAGEESDICGHIHSLVGWTADRTILHTIVGRIVVVHDGGAVADRSLKDNLLARDLITELGGDDCRRGGVHVLCAAGPEDTLAGLTADQVELVSAAIRQPRFA